jgi:hypothetical protein
MYIRGRVSQVIENNGKLQVLGVDTLSGRPVEIDADLVVLAAAMGPADRNEIASTLRIAADSHGFFKEAHPKLRPVETLTAGIFLAGTAQAPKDIPDTVSQASAAASKGMELLSHEMLQRDPSTLFRVPPGLSLQRDREARDSRFRRSSPPGGGVAEPGDVRGLRSLHRDLPRRIYRPRGLQR